MYHDPLLGSPREPCRAKSSRATQPYDQSEEEEEVERDRDADQQRPGGESHGTDCLSASH